MMSSTTRAFCAGILVANSAPHLATAAAGRRHLTPLAGRDSGPRVNALWGALNLGAGLALLFRRQRGTPKRWSDELPSFETGYLVFAVWMAMSERFLATNWTKDTRR